MKIFFLIIVFWFCSILFSIGSDSENFNLSFRRISPVGGFTYGAINSIGEDSDGFIWFGTVHGLYNYNSVDVQKFIHNPLDSTTIPSNVIRAILGDSNGTLWIGTNQGVCTYDKNKNQFTRLKLQDQKTDEFLGNNIRCIFQEAENTIYLLSSSLLGKLNIETNQFEKIFSNDSLSENFATVGSNKKGQIWIGGTNGTVWQYDVLTQQIKKFCHFRSEAIRKIFADDNGIWIGFNWEGLDHVGLDGNLIAHYGGSQNDVNKIHHNRVRDIYKDEKGRIWVSTYKGISIISEGKVFNILPQEITGLPYNSIYRIFNDSKNGMWIGTWSGGLAYQSNFDNRFIHSQKAQPYFERDDEFVSSFAEKPDGTVFIGTEFGNLNVLDRESNQMVKIPFTTENNTKIENIKSLLFDNQSETLWVGTFLDGLWFQKKDDFVLHELKKFNESRVSIYALAKADSLLLIGTYGDGLYCYNTFTGNITQHIFDESDKNSISNNNIRSIIIAKDKSVWIGTNSGLNQFDIQTGSFKRFTYNSIVNNSISSDEIFSLLQDAQGMIWIGTSGGGLNKFNTETHAFESFQIKDGLAGNDVYGIEEDKNGMLWISTDNGITNVDPINHKFRNFYREDELQGSQFNPGAVFQTSKGEILFGDTKGFTFFTPEQMKTNPFPPKVVLTSLAINNIPVNNLSENSPLSKTLQSESQLKLSYNQNSLRFSFVANNFLLPNKNKFRYRLINYDNNWIDAENQNFASYTKIPPGDYLFEVIACNNDNLWNEVPTQLKVKISPPFWFAWYAYFVYILVSVLIAYFIRRWILERQRLKKELLLERYTHESETQIQELKLRFFTNISHEFRTPLTLIASPINQLLEKFRLEPLAREHLLTMQRNSNRLLRLINQLIDIRKIESGKAVFQPRKTDLISLCKEVINCFEMEAKDKSIHLSFSAEDDKLFLFLDAERVDKIFFNILSNAMRYTPEKGSVGISIYTTHSTELAYEGIVLGDNIDGNIVCVEFSDNGPGIAPDDIKSIFERFEQGKNHQTSGTGIGLHMAYEYTLMHKGNIRIKSKLGTGSVFTICFPFSEANDELVEDYEDHGSKKEEIPLKINNDVQGSYSEKDKSLTILIIEDNYELRTFLKNLLNQYYKVVTSPNGKQGLETALTILPDLVISDVMMPQMDGLEVCRQLKNDIQSSHIPVILLTALNDSEEQVGGFLIGADAYITKPFDENILLAWINNLIRSRAKLRELFSVSDSEWANGMELLTSDRMLIDKATSIVEQHLNDNTFVVDNISAKLGISSSSLYRKLKSLTNQSPTEFVRNIRLRKAIKLMDSGNVNLDEIGYSVGFNSHSYFTSSFRKQFGKTPSEYISDLKIKSTLDRSRKN